MHSHVDALRFPEVTTMLTEGPDAVASDFVIEDAWGVTVDSIANSPEFARQAPIEGILDLSGEWWCVAKARDGRRLVLADRFGIQPLAIATATTLDGPALWIGSSAAATARAVRAAGGQLPTNWSHVLEVIGAQHDFLDCLFDFSTPTAGIVLVPADRAVEIGSDGYRIVPRPTVRAEGSYESLLTTGIARAMEDVRRLVNSHETTVINLSGGKDSRVVLAIVMAAGYSDRIQVAATAPRPAGAGIAHAQTVTEDLAISAQLVKGLGLQWVDRRPPRDYWPSTLEGELANFQHYRHGLTNQFVPLGLTYQLLEPQARINGAGGEIFRQYWSHKFSKHYVWKTMQHTEASREGDARLMLRALRSRLPIPEDLAEEGEASFLEGINHVSQGTLAHALDHHYLAFRMRGHAGGRRWGQTYGITNYSLLQQSALSRAAERLDPVEREGGKLLFDIIEQLAPELNDLEYQSGPWMWRPQRERLRDWSTVGIAMRRYRQAEERAARSSRPNAYRTRPRPDMSAAILDGLRALSDQMRADGFDHTLLGPILEDPPTTLRLQGRMLARLFNWASSFGDDRMCPIAVAAHPPRVRTYLGTA